MRHLLIVLFVGCGGGRISGEPIMGTVTLDYGGSKPKMAVGAAVQDMDNPAKMLVQIGSDNVDCDTYLDVFLDLDAPSGSFVYFTVDKAATGTINTSVSVQKSGSRSTAVNTGSGVVMISGSDPRVTGSVTFAVTDEEVGMITVAGTFDVKRCF